MRTSVEIKETSKGTRYVYYLDGQKVRTSMRKYDYMATITLEDGENRVIALGKYESCEKELKNRILNNMTDCQKTLDWLEGRMTETEFTNSINRNYMFALDYTRDVKQDVKKEGLEQVIERKRESLKWYEDRKPQVIKIEF